jgi:hypothetical protein
MARAALEWGVRDLAERCGASPQTVVRFEKGEDLKASTIQRFRDQFEAAGIVFLAADKIAGEGARFAKTKKPSNRR